VPPAKEALAPQSEAAVYRSEAESNCYRRNREACANTTSLGKTKPAPPTAST